MRDLIRPGLFVIVRLGLLLSTSAWIFSQGYFMGIVAKPGMTAMIVIVDGRGMRFGRVFWGPDDNKVQVGMASDLDESSNVQKLNPAFMMSMGPRQKWFWFGCMFELLLVIPHWLIVLCFAIFYGTVKIVYRITAATSDTDQFPSIRESQQIS